MKINIILWEDDVMTFNVDAIKVVEQKLALAHSVITPFNMRDDLDRLKKISAKHVILAPHDYNQKGNINSICDSISYKPPTPDNLQMIPKSCESLLKVNYDNTYKEYLGFWPKMTAIDRKLPIRVLTITLDIPRARAFYLEELRYFYRDMVNSLIGSIVKNQRKSTIEKIKAIILSFKKILKKKYFVDVVVAFESKQASSLLEDFFQTIITPTEELEKINKEVHLVGDAIKVGEKKTKELRKEK